LAVLLQIRRDPAVNREGNGRKRPSKRSDYNKPNEATEGGNDTDGHRGR